MKYYTSILLFFLLGSTGISVHGQVVFATETFGTGSAQGTLANGFVGDMGTWTVSSTGVNGINGNIWYVSGEECGNAVGICGSACPGGDNSLHVSAIGGLCGAADCGAAYNAGAADIITNLRAESPIIDCTGNGNISLNFNYIAAQADDGYTVEYSANGGATWTTISTPVASLCCACNDPLICLILGFCCGGPNGPCTGAEQGLWTAFNIMLPASADNNANVKIAFNWSNDGNNIGTDPSVAIDDITITRDIILPIELSEFSAIPQESVNMLYWTTISEINSAFFEIQNSVDGENFETIGKLNSAGNSTSAKNYFYRHQTESQTNYYRLKLYDLDGKFKYSENVYVQNELNGILLYQQTQSFKIIGLKSFSGSVSVFDVSGKKVLKKTFYTKDQDTVSVQTESLMKGIYIVNVEGSNGKKIFRLII